MIINGFIAKARPRGYVGPKHLHYVRNQTQKLQHTHYARIENGGDVVATMRLSLKFVWQH